MPFCSSCGAEVTGRYCAKCGTAAEPEKAPAVQPPVISAAGISTNTAAALTYLLGLLTGILFLVIEPYNKNKLVRFHAFQSIFLNVATVLVWWLLTAILPSLFWSLGRLLELIFFAPFLYLLIQTLQGKKIVLPVIGELAEKQS